jgi:hypothetical protein
VPEKKIDRGLCSFRRKTPRRIWWPSMVAHQWPTMVSALRFTMSALLQDRREMQFEPMLELPLVGPGLAAPLPRTCDSRDELQSSIPALSRS